MKWFFVILVVLVSFSNVYAADKSTDISDINEEKWEIAKNELFIEILAWVKSVKEPAASAAGATKDFLSEQIPLVVNEIVLWGMIKYSLWCFILIIPTILSLIIARSVYKSISVPNPNDNVYMSDGTRQERFNWFVVIMVFAFTFFVFFAVNLFGLCFVYFAPRLYIINYISNIINGNQGGC